MKVGDIVLIYKGRKTNFYEVIKTDDEILWVANGYVQFKANPDDIELICKAENREDGKVPFIPYVN